jgi:choline-sulfatase
MPTSQPNILMIMSDQHNPAMAGYAGNTTISTPHLDRLARRATSFSSAYCTSPICVPARASIATGRYVHEIDAWDNAAPYVGAQPSWGHLLGRAGYSVTTIGKLHYRDAADDTGFPDQRLAMHIHGRGDLLGIAQRPDGAVPTVAGFRTILEAGPGENDYTRYDREVTDAAVQFLGQEIDDQPWALMVSFVAPHFPLVAPQEFFELYSEQDLVPPPDSLGAWDHPAVQVFRESFGIARQFTHTEKQRALQAYLGLCSFMDANVGAVLAALDGSGQTEETVITYTSDHGESAGAHGLWFKHLMNEQSVGVPLLLAGPGFTSDVIDSPVSHVDLLPTFLSLAGLSGAEIEAQCGAPLPGISLADDGALADTDRIVLAEYHANGSIAASFMIRHGRYKYIEYVGERPQLFDLDADPAELVDLARRPDFGGVVAECAARLRQICDPQAVDALAKRDQARRVDEVGGVAAASAHTVAYTPVPGASPAGTAEDSPRTDHP